MKDEKAVALATASRDAAQALLDHLNQETPIEPAFSTPASMTAAGLHGATGVCLHVNYNDGAYQDLERLYNLVIELGVTRVRDGIKHSPQAVQMSLFWRLKKAGIGITMVVGNPRGDQGSLAKGQSAKLIEHLKNPKTYAFVDRLEGPNEWDANGGSTWIADLKAFMAEYYAAVKADPATRHIPFYQGSMAGGLNYKKFVDTNNDGGNLHTYMGGQWPERDDLNVDDRLVDQRRAAIGSVGAGKPIITTEFGENNALQTTNGNQGVPEDVKCHYLIRRLVYEHSLGSDEMDIYQLLDQNPNPNLLTNYHDSLGLVGMSGTRAPYTATKKPSFEAVKRFQAHLKDDGPGTAPTALPFRVVSKSESTLVIPIARKDGSFDVACWMANPLWDTSARKAVADKAGTVKLEFAQPVSLYFYRPSVSADKTPVQDGVRAREIPISGAVTFVRCVPNS